MADMTLEEALAAADVEERDTAVNDIITIDSETRKINVPDSESVFGVETDMDVERKYFRCPRVVGDNIDLSAHKIYIVYVTAKDVNGTFLPDLVNGKYWCEDVSVEGDYITFSWRLSGNVLSKSGIIAFKVLAKTTDGSVEKTRWNTSPAYCTVLMTVPDGDNIEEQYPDIVTQLLERMDAVEAIATPEAVHRYVEEYLEEHPVAAGATEEQAAQIEQNTNGIAELKSDLSELSDEIANELGRNEDGTEIDMGTTATNVRGAIKELKDNQGSGTSIGLHTFLQGKKYYALGDSIVDYQGTTASPKTYSGTDLQGTTHTDETVVGYIQKIEDRYGLICTNYGKGGHTIVGDYSELMTLDYTDVALVTIAYGVNDARTGVTLGTVNSTDGTTFAGALNNILRKIYTDNPECRVIVLTPIQRLFVSDFGIATANSNGNYLIDFVDMCKKVAQKRSTKCIDMYRDCGINQTNLYYYTREGVHPLNTGYLRMASPIIDALDGMFAIEFNPFGSMTNTGDTEPDEPDNGGGDSGGDIPTEDPTGTVVSITEDMFVNDGTVIDNYGTTYDTNQGHSYTSPIELISGKTYTLVTPISSRGELYICVTNNCDNFTDSHRNFKTVSITDTGQTLTVGSKSLAIYSITLVVPTDSTYYLWINKYAGVDVSNISLSFI